MLNGLKKARSRWVVFVFGGSGVAALFAVGGYTGTVSATVLMDVLVRTSRAGLWGVQPNGLIIGFFFLSIAVAGVGFGSGFLRSFWGRERGAEAPRTTPALHQMREGDQVDYDLRTWTVTGHVTLPYQGWPAEMWTLAHEDDTRLLEYDRAEGGTFRLYESARVRDVTSTEGEPLGNRRTGTPPPTVVYGERSNRSEYVLVEEDARVHDAALVRSKEEAASANLLVRSRTSRSFRGVLGGLAEYLNGSPRRVRFGYLFSVVAVPSVLGLMGRSTGIFIGMLGLLFAGYFVLWGLLPDPPPERLAHYWVYENENGDRLTLQRTEDEDTWTVRVGREVAPYEFDNILPAAGT